MLGVSFASNSQFNSYKCFESKHKASVITLSEEAINGFIKLALLLNLGVHSKSIKVFITVARHIIFHKNLAIKILQKWDKSWRVYRENSFEQIWFGQRKSTSGCVLKWEQMNVAQSKC